MACSTFPSWLGGVAAPALLSLRLSLLAQKRTVFQRIFGKPKLLPWSIQGSGKPGTWGRIATRIVRHPVPTLVTGLVVFGGLAFAVLGYTASGFGGSDEEWRDARGTLAEALDPARSAVRFLAR